MKTSWMLLSWACASVLQHLPDTKSFFKSHSPFKPPQGTALSFPSPFPRAENSSWHEPAGRKTLVWICSTPPTHPGFQSATNVPCPTAKKKKIMCVFLFLSKGSGCAGCVDLKTPWQEKPEGGTPSASAQLEITRREVLSLRGKPWTQADPGYARSSASRARGRTFAALTIPASLQCLHHYT